MYFSYISIILVILIIILNKCIAGTEVPNITVTAPHRTVTLSRVSTRQVPNRVEGWTATTARLGRTFTNQQAARSPTILPSDARRRWIARGWGMEVNWSLATSTRSNAERERRLRRSDTTTTIITRESGGGTSTLDLPTRTATRSLPLFFYKSDSFSLKDILKNHCYVTLSIVIYNSDVSSAALK